MMQFSKDDISKMHHLYRINLINSCTGYKSANLIGTKDSQGQTNLAVFSSVTHMGSNPGIIGFFTRPTTVVRHTYENIKETGYYTINAIHDNIIEDAHHTSAKYDKLVSEFEVTNLEEEYKGNCPAPFVKNAPIQIEMKFLEEYYINANNTILVVGTVENIYLQDQIIEIDGFLNLTVAEVATINGLDGYAVPKLKSRLEYQRPKAGFAHRDN